MKEILISSRLKQKIANELNTSRQNVHAALRYFNNSDVAIAVRKRAKELLIEEANKIEIEQP
ncbi:hypothetical protein [Empedobacter falsenii]|uniref:Uncharacterized protein n=1 Tax=Empedobacter falsenii TaxID=343874 RepID=A0AAW7DF45_9FLAO|nr:hypothetical protein [Empedobacter falsenii]MDM1550624.1 hypothetical protein [Empedobacter falsenii]